MLGRCEVLDKDVFHVDGQHLHRGMTSNNYCAVLKSSKMYKVKTEDFYRRPLQRCEA